MLRSPLDPRLRGENGSKITDPDEKRAVHAECPGYEGKRWLTPRLAPVRDCRESRVERPIALLR